MRGTQQDPCRLPTMAFSGAGAAPSQRFWTRTTCPRTLRADTAGHAGRLQVTRLTSAPATPSASDIHGALAHKVNERAKPGRHVPVGGIVDSQALKIRTPVLEHGNETPFGDVPGHAPLVRPDEAHAVECRRHHQLMAIQAKRAIDIDPALLTALPELPAVPRATWQAATDTGVLQQVLGHPGLAAILEVVGRTDDKKAQAPRAAYSDHVLWHVIERAYPCVEALRDDVYEAPFRHDIHAHRRIATHVLQQDRLENHRRRTLRRVDAKRARRAVTEGVGRFHRRGDFAEGRTDSGNELLAGLGQRDTARGPVEQAPPHPLLQRRPRVAERGRRHADRNGSPTKALMGRYGEDGLQFDEPSLVHCANSCIDTSRISLIVRTTRCNY